MNTKPIFVSYQHGFIMYTCNNFDMPTENSECANTIVATNNRCKQAFYEAAV